LKLHNHKVDELIERLVDKSDEQAMYKLFEIYYDSLITSSIVIVKSRDLAEEVVSDVFYRLWINRKKLKEVKNLDNYLFISVRNYSLNYLKKEKKIIFQEINEDADKQSADFINIEDLIFAQELREKINTSIEKLPPKCKQIFKMVRAESLKQKEVAQKLKISVHTVENQMRIALNKIKEELGFIKNK
jgi:RNA polymerase sigma-70 factor (ECF subfamily)